MQTRALRTFVRIAQLGSFIRAAEQLNMTLSGVSMQMKALEQELDAELFDRTFRPPRLTPTGRAAAEKAERVLIAETALVQLCTRGDRLVGRFSIGFVSTASVRLLPAFIREARTRFPEAEFRFETGLSETLQDKVLNGQIDAAVVTGGGTVPSGLHAVTLQTEALVFAGHCGLLQDGQAEAFARQTFLHFRPGTGIGKTIAAHMARLARSGSAPTIVLDSVESIMECVNQGIGLTLLPQPDIERYAGPDTVAFTLPGFAATRELVLVTRDDAHRAEQAAMLATLFAGQEGRNRPVLKS